MKLLKTLAVILIVVLFITLIYVRVFPQNYISLKLKKSWDGLMRFLNIQKENLLLEVSPPRCKKLTMIETESWLRQFSPEPFMDFNDNDWDEFWKIFYAPVETKEDKFIRRRMRTKEEIEVALMERYPQPFRYLDDNYWKIFWDHILNVRWDEAERHFR